MRTQWPWKKQLLLLAVVSLAALVGGCSGDKKKSDVLEGDVAADVAGDGAGEEDVEQPDVTADGPGADLTEDIGQDLPVPEDLETETGNDADDVDDTHGADDGDGSTVCDGDCNDAYGDASDVIDPCTPNPCTEAPAPYCEDDAMTAVEPQSPGVCTVSEQGEAVCEYPENSTNCADEQKACQDGACVEVQPQCVSHCDCTQGMSCVEGECMLIQPLKFCCGEEGCPYGATCLDTAGVQGTCGLMPGEYAGKIVFNEVLSDGSTDVDPNGGDDSGDSLEDEFIEFVNVSADPIDLGGFTILEETMPNVPRHTFAPGTMLGPGLAVVVFGGGDAPDATATAMFFVANAADPGLPYGLSLNNDGDAVKLLDAAGALVAEFNYGGDSGLEPAFDESLTRLPDKTGEFVPHSQAADAQGAIFSPGTKLDGTSF